LEWLVPVPNVFKPMDLVFWREKGSGDGVDRRITPAFIVETAELGEVVEKVDIRL
jgi:hypothetical protein